MTGPRPAGRRWTREADDQLRAMLEAGAKAPEIARKLKRTSMAVYARARVKKMHAEMIYDVPTHRERQFMQYLRAGGWVKASVIPAGARLIETLLAKGWIEKRGIVANDVTYRITDKCLAAKKMPVRV